MVTVIALQLSKNEEGKPFISLKIQGEVEAIQSQQTGRFYLSAKTCLIPSTFDEPTAKALIGSQLPGQIIRAYCEPYKYIVKETGETITLSHRYEYLPDEESNSADEKYSNREVVDLMG
ncbi:hypothetical protein [Asinibacterium sp. OR53]|uniref:hypothetical protein n=1 Tax=Asinibacterium sp. OR53 TaxID=925409 RepID=UPI0004793B1B|nr:hypothetical protein [Asinibacterium sp. OR53]